MKRKVLGEAPLDIGGWLIVIGIRLFGSAMINGRDIYMVFFTGASVTGILFLLTLIYAFAVLIIMVNKYKGFPYFYIGFEAIAIFFNIAVAITESISGTEVLWLLYLATVLISVLLILYILLSKRVKRTFVLNWDKSIDQRLVDKANGIQA
jgi:hypothetical protein